MVVVVGTAAVIEVVAGIVVGIVVSTVVVVSSVATANIKVAQ